MAFLPDLAGFEGEGVTSVLAARQLLHHSRLLPCSVFARRGGVEQLAGSLRRAPGGPPGSGGTCRCTRAGADLQAIFEAGAACCGDITMSVLLSSPGQATALVGGSSMLNDDLRALIAELWIVCCWKLQAEMQCSNLPLHYPSCISRLQTTPSRSSPQTATQSDYPVPGQT